MPEYGALAAKMHSASISIIRASGPLDKGSGVLDADRAQAHAGGEMNETMYQVQRIGDFAESDQRSGIDELHQSAGVAHSQKDQHGRQRNNQQIGRAVQLPIVSVAFTPA